MSKSGAFTFSVLTALLSLFFQPLAGQHAGTKPNIIFILTDDLGYGDVGSFFQKKRLLENPAAPAIMTPHIDQLAAGGARLTQQYSNAPVCAPSRASLLTGLHQGNARVRDNQFDKALENNHTLASVLKHAGYATLAVGKWGLQGEEENAPDWPAHPLKRGFDHFFGYMRHRDGHEHYPFEGVYRGSKEVWHDYTNIAQQLARCYTTDLWTAYTKKWLIDYTKTNGDKPFFIYLAYDAPHAVLELPTQAYPEGGGISGGLRWQGTDGQMINTASGTVDSYIPPFYDTATYDHDNDAHTPSIAWPETYKRYATSVTRIDDGVGDLMTLLQDLRLDSNTIVVFSSDNGPSIESYLPPAFVPNVPTFFESYGPFDGIKRDCWEGGLRMPTIVSWPSKIHRGITVTTPSTFADWLPTFCQIAGEDIPARADGVSLLPSLTSNDTQAPPPVYVEYFESGNTPDFQEFEASRRGRKRGQMQMIRLGNFAGVRYNIQSAGDNFEIYNVVDDPKQTVNLATKKEFQRLQQQMKMKVLQGRIADSTAPRPYDTAMVAAVSVQGKLSPGMAARVLQSASPWAVSERSVTVSTVVELKDFRPAKKLKGSGTLMYEAWFHAPRGGRYDFRFRCEPHMLVRLHDALFFDVDFDDVPGSEKSRSVYLSKGLHPVRIYVKLQQGKFATPVIYWRNDATEWKRWEQRDFYISRPGDSP